METILPKLKFCDKVVSKKTGFPGVGEVVGISVAGWYYGIQVSMVSEENRDKVCSRWFEAYPNWLHYPLVTVFYTEPRKTLTWEEYASVAPNPSQFEYEAIPKTQSIMYPIEDLELFDETV